MAAVTVLTVGSQARSGASNALDVTAYSTLRLDLTTRANLGLSPYLRTFIETGPTSSGPWTVLEQRSRTTGATAGSDNAWPASFSERVILAAFDKFVRLRWAGGREGEGGITTIDPGFVIGLTGEAQP